MLLAPDCDIEYAGASYGDWRLFVGRPMHRIGQELPVVDAQNFPERAVDVPGEINHAAFSLLTSEDLCNVGLSRSGINLFHGQVRIGGNQSQRRSGKGRDRIDVEPPHTVYDPRRVFESFEQYVGVRRGPVQSKIGIVHRALSFSLEPHTKKLAQAKILSLFSPFIEKRCLE